MARHHARKLLLGLLGGGSSSTPASLNVVTTGAATATITLTVSASTVVDWGDGSQDAYTGSGSRTHDYAGAGTWTVRILQPANVTEFATDGAAYAVNSATLKPMINLQSLDVRWSRAGCVLNTADFAHMPLSTRFYIYFIPAATVVFNSADIVNWNPTVFWVAECSSITTTVSASHFAGLTKCNDFSLSDNGMTQAKVDAALLGLYTAAQSKTTNGGTLRIAGSNAAPSGTYAAANPPTTGKEAAYELINDSNGVIPAGKEWTTVTVTGGLP